MTADLLLCDLPKVQWDYKLIKKNQSVRDIMQEILDAHDVFADDYDLIAFRFLDRNNVETLKRIFWFLKTNIRYEEEPTRRQVTKSPGALIESGEGDCKCFALFTAGILGALNRIGGKFDWNFAFASYTAGSRTPAHAFVEVVSGGKTYWVDPVLDRFDMRDPMPEFITREFVDDMALYRLSGVPETKSMVKSKNRIGAVTVGDWVRENPMLTVAGLVALYLLFSSAKPRI